MDPSHADKPSFEDAYPEIAREARKCARRLRIAYDRDFDVVAEAALITAAERWSGYDPREPLAAWIRGIIDPIAARQLGLGENIPEHEAEKARRAVDARLTPLVRLLAPMEEDLRIVFELREIDGFTVAEIAAMLAISRTEAYSRLRAATRELGLRARSTSEPCAVEAWIGKSTEWSFRDTFS